MSAFKNNKDQENARMITQCALFENMLPMSQKFGSPYPGARDGIEPDDAGQDANIAGVKLGASSLNKSMDPIDRQQQETANTKQIINATRCVPKNAVLYQAPPEYTVAHLMRQTDVTPFFEATPAQLSSLVPKLFVEYLVKGKWIKLRFASKAVSENIDNRQRLLLTPAEDFEEEEDLFNEILGTEDGYLAEGGIKRFEFELDNNMFYERNIKATLELHFKHASDLGLDMYRRLFRLSDGLTEAGPTRAKVESANLTQRFEEIRDCAILLKNAGIHNLIYNPETGIPATFPNNNEAIRGLSPNIGTILSSTAEGKAAANKILSMPLNRVKNTANADARTFTGQQVGWTDGWLNDETPVSKTSRSKHLKCTMGWADYNADIDGFSKRFNQAVKETQRTFVLNMTDYDVDFKEDGQLSITFNYIASIDAYTRQSPRMDVIEHLFKPRKDDFGREIPKEYDHVLVGIPSDDKLKKLYRPLANYAIMGRRIKNLSRRLPSGVMGTENEFAQRLDNARGVDFTGPENILELKAGQRSAQARERILSGAGIEGSTYYQYSAKDRPDGAYGFKANREISLESLREKRMKTVSGGGYLLTRLVYQLKDPLTGKTVFQAQEKGILAELSLIEKEISYLREEIKVRAKNKPKLKTALEKMMKQLREAYAVTKEILIEARTFRKTARSAGFLKSFHENKILRMASLETETYEDVVREGGNFSRTLEDYQKQQPATVKFYDIHLKDIGGQDQGASTYVDNYIIQTKKLAALKTYDKRDKPNSVLSPGIMAGDETFIPFVQLGHLLSHMMGYRKNYGLILGTFKMPTSEGEKVIYNISDIPITLPMLMAWYFKQVINTGREVYPFRTAMRDLLTDLVQPLLSKYCLSTNLEKGEAPPAIKFSNLTTLVGTFSTRGDEATFGATKDKSAGILDPGEFDAIQGGYGHEAFSNYLSSPNRLRKFAYTATQVLKNPVPHSQIAAAAANQIRHYYVIHSTCPVKRSGDYNKDMKEGIYHLILGRDRGILKRASFSRKEMPYLESRNVEQASAGNLDAVLTIPMDADVELFGNNYFQHGQMVYINAEFGLSKILAESMRVGGYYMVTKVSNSMDNSGWTTNLKCIWQSQEYSDTRWGGEA